MEKPKQQQQKTRASFFSVRLKKENNPIFSVFVRLRDFDRSNKDYFLGLSFSDIDCADILQFTAFDLNQKCPCWQILADHYIKMRNIDIFEMIQG